MTVSQVKSIRAFKYEIKDGKCPIKPGEVSSLVHGQIDLERLDGLWINIYDRKILNKNLQCYGIKLLRADPPYDEDKESRLAEDMENGK